jgi:adenosylmethionine-8-amino-7-oxononanoate aminotransferase
MTSPHLWLHFTRMSSHEGGEVPVIVRGSGQYVFDQGGKRYLDGLSGALFDAGLICRADDRGDPVIQLSPPLTCGQEHFDEMEQILRSVLTQAWSQL